MKHRDTLGRRSNRDGRNETHGTNRTHARFIGSRGKEGQEGMLGVGVLMCTFCGAGWTRGYVMCNVYVCTVAAYCY